MITEQLVRKGVFQNLQPLILASASPRRRELLGAVGLTFEVFPSGVEEGRDPGERGAIPRTLVERWASEKALAVAQQRPDSWVLGADTIVLLGGKIYGKPGTSEEAASMLNELSGRTHQVMSAICLSHYGKHFLHVQATRTLVSFKDLTGAEIQAYVESGEPFDKAGAYGIQGIGAFLVQSIQGSYTNVVGLPLCETLDLLVGRGVIAPLYPQHRDA